MWTRGRVTLARSGCRHISLVQEQSRQHVRRDCSTKVSDDRNKSSRCNALQAAENSISKAQPLQMAARAKEAVARYGDRGNRHRNESAATGNQFTSLRLGEASHAHPKGSRATSDGSLGGVRDQTWIEQSSSLSSGMHGPGETGETKDIS